MNTRKERLHRGRYSKLGGLGKFFKFRGSEMLFPAFFRRKFSVNKMKENTIFRCLFYISSVFGKIQYGKKGTTVTPSSK